jgi:hypothetical protein
VTDWLEWHAAYEDPDSPLVRRLTVVRRLLDDAVRSHSAGTLRVLSLCAGDGRDVLPVLGAWRRRKTIAGRLVEREPALVERARASAARERLERLEIVCADAARPATYQDATAADLVLACGIFGNVSDPDVRRFIEALPAICARGANVVWTRHRRDPDLTPAIREWFAAAGFEECAFESPGAAQFSVGRNRLLVDPVEQALPDPLFTFVR